MQPVCSENDADDDANKDREKYGAEYAAAASAPFGAKMLLPPVVDLFDEEELQQTAQATLIIVSVIHDLSFICVSVRRP